MYQIKFDIHSYWRAGTGRGGGALLDEVVHKDAYDLPCIPGRSVKGLLRNAVYCAEKWGLLNDSGGDPKNTALTQSWFGTKGDHLKNSPGILGFSDAVLEPDLLDYLLLLREETNGLELFQEYVRYFYHYIHATAIDANTGSAKDKSLRAMEVTIPLTLTAQLHILQPEQLNTKTPKWCEILTRCLPLIRGLGTSRNRGLGRVTVTLEDCSNASQTV